jgi:hypothetical protein
VSGRDEESKERRSDIDGKVRDARHGKSSAVISVVSSTSREADVRRLDVLYEKYLVVLLTICNLCSNLFEFIRDLSISIAFFTLEAGHVSVIAARHWNFYFSRHTHKATHVIDDLKQQSVGIQQSSIWLVNGHVLSLNLAAYFSALKMRIFEYCWDAL